MEVAGFWKHSERFPERLSGWLGKGQEWVFFFGWPVQSEGQEQQGGSAQTCGVSGNQDVFNRNYLQVGVAQV